MKYTFDPYKPRKIEFQDLVTINDCKVKVYTITNRPEFESVQILENSIKELPNWILNIKNSTLPTYNNAFLIVHEAREGVLVLLNWFTGENMVETKIHFADFNNPSEIKPSIYNPKALVCIWELEIFAHERKAWIQHVLSQANSPDFNSYINDIMNNK